MSQLIKLLNDTRLSPEALALRLRVSNMTYRRWLKFPPDKEVPKEYAANIATGIYTLLEEGRLDYNSAAVNAYLRHNLPSFFQAAIGQFSLTPDVFDKTSSHQANITNALAQIGSSSQVRKKVNAADAFLRKCGTWGAEWKHRLTTLRKVIASSQHDFMDKCVAYGALFYLIIPFDLIPDAIPVFGYVDDFGILGFATAFYASKYKGASRVV